MAKSNRTSRARKAQSPKPQTATSGPRPDSDSPIEDATLKVIRARTLIEVLEELTDGDEPTLRIVGRANDDVLVTTLSTIRGLMQDAERALERAQ